MQGPLHTISQAKEMVEQQESVVWETSEDVIREHPVIRTPLPRCTAWAFRLCRTGTRRGKAIRNPSAGLHWFQRGLDGGPDGRAHSAFDTRLRSGSYTVVHALGDIQFCPPATLGIGLSAVPSKTELVPQIIHLSDEGRGGAKPGPEGPRVQAH